MRYTPAVCASACLFHGAFVHHNLADPSDSAITPSAKMHVIFLMHIKLAQDDNYSYVFAVTNGSQEQAIYF